ncbi:MAG: sulfotransferase family protein, partial [Pseudomonadales bacterium]
MHRSGTSAITRALKVLGVDLGGRLLSAADGDDGDNETGFWEDSDFNALNIELLRAIDKDWFYTSPVTQIDLEILNKQGYFLKAETLVKEKLKDRTLLGVKDPRMAKLLPFWKEVFARSDINVNYVLAIRQPLSVVKSIENRGWEGRERLFLLWLNYVIQSLSLTDSTSRVIVDYDHLVRDSANELERMAHSLNLSVDKKELVYYQSEFLDHDLQHSKYQPQDCGLDSDCPALAAEIYLKLQAVILESGCADDAGFQQQVMQWTDEFDRLGPMLTYIDRTLVESIQAAGRQRQKESENADLRHEVAENHRKFGEVSEILSHREHEASDLREALSELAEQNGHRCREIDALTRQVTEIQSSTSWRITAPIRLVKKTCGALYLSLSSKRRNNNDFNPDWYLEQNPDVKNSGQDPLAHYLEYGQAAGRAPRSSSFFFRNKNRLQIMALMTSQVIKKTGGIYAVLK